LDTTDGNLSLQDENGNSALMIAAQFGFDRLESISVERDADVHLQDQDRVSVSTIAFKNGHKVAQKIRRIYRRCLSTFGHRN
jgi:ankyrin repeat protein